MADVQVLLVYWLAHAAPPIHAFMNSQWGWPMAESIHFLGLSMLVGCVGVFDLRLLGMAKRIPIAALHKLIPWGLLGFAINATSGACFLLTEPDQYIYNPSFQFKVLFIMIAGLNALLFYVTSWGRVNADGTINAPRAGKIAAAISLSMWISVIVCGRLLTFYRPGPCPKDGPGLIADCTPRGQR
jgi:cytochrome bd-type quinol oxidase subunit 1